MAMNPNKENERGMTRRQFVKQLTVGAAGVAAASKMGTSSIAAAQAPQAVIRPKNAKFTEYVKPMIFKDPGWGSMRPVTKMDGAFLGHDVTIEYGTIIYAGKMGKEPYGAHVHDFDQVLFFLGGDCKNMDDLNAEIELCLGEEKEKHLIKTTTTVFIPKGLPHFPATVKKMDKRFYYMEISLAGEKKGTPVAGGPEPTMVAGRASKHRSHIVRPSFMRKAPGGMDPNNQDDSGGSLAFITGKDFHTLIMCESLMNAPYRFPNPACHTHTQPQFICFMGGDPDDPTNLGGEIELYLGAKEEMERYIVTVPSVWIIPAKVPHCPLIITKVDKPFILTDIRPFGEG
jgi:hypothetical protein